MLQDMGYSSLSLITVVYDLNKSFTVDKWVWDDEKLVRFTCKQLSIFFLATAAVILLFDTISGAVQLGSEGN